ncbi:MAG: hypothetical protein IT215_01130 [Chitinophagaceae bacterium]|nr:hypothetical protein [Chitinophagaceae bacterium]
MTTTQKNIGYRFTETTQRQEQFCFLTIGSIIIFNNRKKIVTHTYPTGDGRKYKYVDGKCVGDITLSFHGFLKDIETGEEVRSNWAKTTQENILHFENLEIVNP